MAPLPLASLPELTEEERIRLLGDPKYDHLILRKYRHWTLYLHENQAHFGRAYAWLSRRHEDRHGLEDLRPVENKELLMALRDYRRALTVIAGITPDLVNCEWLGNEMELHRGHGHMHFIPRFRAPPRWDGHEHVDLTFGHRSDYRKHKMLPGSLERLVLAFERELLAR